MCGQKESRSKRTTKTTSGRSTSPSFPRPDSGFRGSLLRFHRLGLSAGGCRASSTSTLAGSWAPCSGRPGLPQDNLRPGGIAVFAKQPTSNEVRAFLGRAIAKMDASPRYIISDLGSQFDCPGYRGWCARKDIIPRYASKESIRATAIIERFFLSLKNEMLRRVAIPFRREGMRRAMATYLGWYHEFRPHQGLCGRTPQEVYDRKKPANERVRFEPRPGWPSDSPCAKPVVRPKKRGVGKLTLEVEFLADNENLAVVRLRRAA